MDALRASSPSLPTGSATGGCSPWAAAAINAAIYRRRGARWSRASASMFRMTMDIAGFDPQLAAAVAGEQRRQEEHIELIASENYASPRVLEAQGSGLTNKYAEGYPARRYYAGCEV